MTVSIAGNKVARSTFYAGLGAALAMLATVLVWASYSQGAGMGGPRTESVTGLDYGNGKIVLGLAVVVAGLIVAWYRKIEIAGLWGIIAIFGGLTLLVMILTYFTNLFYPRSMPILGFAGKADLNAALGEIGRMFDHARAEGRDISGSGAGLGIGFFAAVVAGGLMIAGGIMGLLDFGGTRRGAAQSPASTARAPRTE
jgi:hypothetical protein